MELPDELVTPRLLLRASRVELAEELFAVFDAERERLSRTMQRTDQVQTVEDQIAKLRKQEQDRAAGLVFAYVLYKLVDGEPGPLIGAAGVHNVSEKYRRAELGYWVAHDFEGQGFVSEAAAAMEASCFEAGCHRIEIRCSSRNPRSAGVPIRLGYRLEGRLRDHWLDQGEWSDELIYAKLRGE